MGTVIEMLNYLQKGSRGLPINLLQQPLMHFNILLMTETIHLLLLS